MFYLSAGIVRLRRRLSFQRLNYSLTVMALSEGGQVSDPHAQVDIHVHTASLTDGPGRRSRPRFTQRLYQMNISEDAQSPSSVGTVSTTQGETTDNWKHFSYS